MQKHEALPFILLNGLKFKFHDYFVVKRLMLLQWNREES